MRTLLYPDLEPSTLLEILPAVTYSQKFADQQRDLVRIERLAELSLTGKYGITSDLILDGTYNPDFSQIEADAGQVDVNLRYGLFFPEKRPFFLEGSENFNLAATSAVQVIHTRTIVNPFLGIKLSGKLSTKHHCFHLCSRRPTRSRAWSVRHASALPDTPLQACPRGRQLFRRHRCWARIQQKLQQSPGRRCVPACNSIEHV